MLCLPRCQDRRGALLGGITPLESYEVAARNRLVEKKMLTKNDAPSYFIECLLYNVPDGLYAPKLAPRYTAIIDWLKTADLRGFKCQNGRVDLFGSGK